MNTELVRAAATVDAAQLGEVMAASGYFTDAKDAAQAAVKILTGRELGFGPAASMTGIAIIQGKPAVGSAMLAGLVRDSDRYDYRIKTLTDTQCVLEVMDNGEKIGESTFTIDDAKRAGLSNKQNWKMYPRNMLFARAISNLVTFYAPDLTRGAALYEVDELDGRREPPAVVADAPEGTAAEAVPTVETISVEQQRAIHAKAGAVELVPPPENLKDLIVAIAGTPHTDRIAVEHYEAIMGAMDDVAGFWIQHGADSVA